MIYHTLGTPSETDPLGALGEGEPTTLPVRAARAVGDTFTITIDSFGTRTEVEGVTEGDQPGQVQERSRVARRRSMEIRERLRRLRSGAPVPVQLAIEQSLAKAGRRQAAPIAEQLLTVAEDSQQTALVRAFAAHLLADLLFEDSE